MNRTDTLMLVLCWTSLCYDLRLQNLANDAFPRDNELVDHRIMLSAVTKGFRHLLTWPFSRTELIPETCVQIRINLKGSYTFELSTFIRQSKLSTVIKSILTTRFMIWSIYWSQVLCKLLTADSTSDVYRLRSTGLLTISAMKHRIENLSLKLPKTVRYYKMNLLHP